MTPELHVLPGSRIGLGSRPIRRRRRGSSSTPRVRDRSPRAGRRSGDALLRAERARQLPLPSGGLRRRRRRRGRRSGQLGDARGEEARGGLRRPGRPGRHRLPRAALLTAACEGAPTRRRGSRGGDRAVRAPRAGQGLATSSFPAARWRAALHLHFSTVYRALWSEHYSRTLRVDVRPRVTLRRSANRYLRVTVRSAHRYRGRWWLAAPHRSRLALRACRSPRPRLDGEVPSRAPARHVVRIYVPRSVAGRGYVAGFSRPIQLR